MKLSRKSLNILIGTAIVFLLWQVISYFYYKYTPTHSDPIKYSVLEGNTNTKVEKETTLVPKGVKNIPKKVLEKKKATLPTDYVGLDLSIIDPSEHKQEILTGINTKTGESDIFIKELPYEPFRFTNEFEASATRWLDNSTSIEGSWEPGIVWGIHSNVVIVYNTFTGTNIGIRFSKKL
jgi:hypothetical protein